jgi:hypothetical protein
LPIMCSHGTGAEVIQAHRRDSTKLYTQALAMITYSTRAVALGWELLLRVDAVDKGVESGAETVIPSAEEIGDGGPGDDGSAEAGPVCACRLAQSC